MSSSVRERPATVESSTLAGAVALVTGGGSGLGAAICRELASAGASVVVADVRGSSAERVATELDGSEAIQLDVADERSASAGVASVLDRLGRIDVLVNSAGIDRTAPFDELSIEDWDRIIGVNLRGPVVMTRAVWASMAAAGHGAVVNITSTAATRAWANASVYHATKWGLLGLSRALHVEGRAVGIAVTAVIAGGMATPFLLDRFPDIDRSVLQDPANVARVIRSVLEAPRGSVVPEIMVLPELETSWP
jgi:NAD(P)-dependent dehydrogenase (short-subunit alcohol dehydrogenase family)